MPSEKTESTPDAPRSKLNVTKKKHRDRSDLGPDFIAPDGGWGWVVCFAQGFSNLTTFAPLQQYGLIYRQPMTTAGFDGQQITTIVNVVVSLSALVGIVNGAMFRRFTFRQVALFGSICGFVGVFLSAFCNTFWQYIFLFGCVYGIGKGLCQVATSLAVNTYFKNKRRKATGFSWTLAGMGPIVFPYLSTLLLSIYGAQGTILIYASISLNAVLCAITLQPVLKHTHLPKTKTTGHINDGSIERGSSFNQQADYECKYCQYQKREKRGIFSSQYIFNADDPEKPGYEITEPATPMLARANDGWYGSKWSLESSKRPRYRSMKSFNQDIKEEGGENELDQESSRSKPNHFNREKDEKPCLDDMRCTCAEEKALLQKISEENLEDEHIKSQMTFGQKVVRFFDLDLLKDVTFLHLLIGMTVMTFGEINFSILTPFILKSFGYNNEQISLAMSILATMDMLIRFLGPFALENVKLGNQTLFSIGIIIVSIGRFIVTITDSYYVMLAVFALIGFGRGIRTIFLPLIIPSYVPLARLPAASGLQLLFISMFSFGCGPLLGLISDTYNYKVTIHFINFLCCLALLLWLVDSIRSKSKNKKSQTKLDS